MITIQQYIEVLHFPQAHTIYTVCQGGAREGERRDRDGVKRRGRERGRDGERERERERERESVCVRQRSRRKKQVFCMYSAAHNCNLILGHQQAGTMQCSPQHIQGTLILLAFNTDITQIWLIANFDVVLRSSQTTLTRHAQDLVWRGHMLLTLELLVKGLLI